MMNYVRNVEFQVKPGKSTDFRKVFNDDVLPMLKQQAGFKHELAMMDGTRGVGISVWQDRSSAESYHANTYPEVLKKLTPLIEGAPRIQGFELAATTLNA